MTDEQQQDEKAAEEVEMTDEQNKDAEVEEQAAKLRVREDEPAADSDGSGDGDGEVDEQGAKIRFREDQPVADASSDDDKGEKQYRMSDATLKHSIAPITSATAALR